MCSTPKILSRADRTPLFQEKLPIEKIPLLSLGGFPSTCIYAHFQCCNIPQINTWNKHKCHISITLNNFIFVGKLPPTVRNPKYFQKCFSEGSWLSDQCSFAVLCPSPFIFFSLDRTCNTWSWLMSDYFFQISPRDPLCMFSSMQPEDRFFSHKEFQKWLFAVLSYCWPCANGWKPEDIQSILDMFQPHFFVVWCQCEGTDTFPFKPIQLSTPCLYFLLTLSTLLYLGLYFQSEHNPSHYVCQYT